MAFRSNSYAGLCSSSEQSSEDMKSRPHHTASVEHIDFRKAFDFADKCSKEGSKSVDKISAFKPVYVRRPMQALHSFDSLNTGPDPAVETAQMKDNSALTEPSNTIEHLEGAAGELQRVFDQLAAELEHEANELRKETREKSPRPPKQVYLARANSDCGSSVIGCKTSSQESNSSLVTNERETRLPQTVSNTPASSLKPPLSRGSTSPVSPKRNYYSEGRRGSTGECSSSGWNKSVYTGKVSSTSSSLSTSPVRERFAARRRADSLERGRDVSRSGLEQERDGERSVVTQRITHWEGATDGDASLVSQRKSALEKKREVENSAFSRRRSSLERDVNAGTVFQRRSSMERSVDSAASSRQRSTSRERAEARLTALQKLSASREKFEDYVPCNQRNRNLTSKDTFNSGGLHFNQQGTSDTDSRSTQFASKHNLMSDHIERSPSQEIFCTGDVYKSADAGRVTESPHNDRIEKSGEIRLKKRLSNRESSPAYDTYPGKDVLTKSGRHLSPKVENHIVVLTDRPPSGVYQPSYNSGRLDTNELGLTEQQLFRPICQESDHHNNDHLASNTDLTISVSDFNLSPHQIHSDRKSKPHGQHNTLSVPSSSDGPASIPDEIQMAASVQSQSLSSSTESLGSTDPEEAAADLDFPQVLDKVVSRYELERKSEQESERSSSPIKDSTTGLSLEDKPVFNSAENINKMQKYKISNFFSNENLNHKREPANFTNGILAQTSSESSTKQSFVNPEMPGYVGFANLPNQVHRKSVKKGFEFTLMVVGESGLGKSTLVNSLFMTDLYPERNIPGAAERIHKTVSIEAATVEIEERGVRLRLTVVDTPGYGDAMNSTDCFKSIIKYVDDQFEKYLNDESGLNRKNIVDNRIHACFYFINPAGHGLKPLDIVFMRALHHKVNIVPVIAKADTLTKPEVARLKKKIMDEIEENGINIYSLPDCDSDEDESYKESCEELKAAVPFAVVGSNQVMDVRGHKVRARTYPWGVVEVENPDHCDFIKLRTMFITHMQDLQEVTQEVHYENFRSQRLASGPPKLRASKSRSREVDSALSEQDRLLQERELEIRRMKEELLRMQEQVKKQQQLSMSSGNVADKKTINSNVSSSVPHGMNNRQEMTAAINGQANGKMTKKAPIVQMNQV